MSADKKTLNKDFCQRKSAIIPFAVARAIVLAKLDLKLRSQFRHGFKDFVAETLLQSGPREVLIDGGPLPRVDKCTQQCLPLLMEGLD